LNRLPARLLIALVCLASCTSRARPADLDDLGPVGPFELTERSGRTVRDTDLRGKVWVASFVFTRCSAGCPQVTETMKGLQKQFARYPDVRLVTFTVDPDHDNRDELRRYAAGYEADPERWLFLTGPEKDVYRLLREGFHITAEQNRGADRTPGNEVKHDTKLVLVDRDGHIRGYYDGLLKPIPEEPYKEAEKRFEDGLRRLRDGVATLAESRPGAGPETPTAFNFPAFNATLNALAGALLLLGYGAVRRGLLRLHGTLMMTALLISAIFLTSYLYFHLAVRHGEPTYYSVQNPGAPKWVGRVYLGILISHTVLAALVAPLALFTAYQGLRWRLDRHRRIARWTLPLWLYVSVTGVVVYWMLYRLYPPG
jgi:protein SCO1/2/putative membrane protein